MQGQGNDRPDPDLLRRLGDVPPVEGIIFTDGTSHELDVTVDVVRVGGDGAGSGP